MEQLHQFRARPRKDTPPFPAAECCDYLASGLMEEELGDRSTAAIFAFDEDSIYSFIETKKDYDQLGSLVVKKALNDRNWLPQLVLWADENRNYLRNLVEEKLSSSVIKDLSNEQLAKNYEIFHDEYRYIHLKNTPPWWVGEDSIVGALRERLANELSEPKNIDQALVVLGEGGEFVSDTLKEEESILSIAAEIHALKISDLSSLPADIEDKLETHIKDYSSLPFGYNIGTVWSRDNFIARIKEILSDERDPHERLGEMLSNRETKELARKEFESRNSLSEETIFLGKCLRMIGYLRDQKKPMQVQSHPILIQETHPEIARRLKIEPILLQYIYFVEVAALLRKGAVSEGEKVEFVKRMNEPVVLRMHDLKTDWLYGAQALEFLKQQLEVSSGDIKEIKGSSGNSGKAAGRVRVLMSSKDTHLLQEGEILVTGMTTPDFVPAMRKATAIITNEGGITCHAAIVARELKKPCIIGTKIATKVLKDGDMVEVDADQGMVKIIK